eukprot:SAG31_NODE_6734_length_1907_cov_1.257743_1_plen_452_part_00
MSERSRCVRDNVRSERSRARSRPCIRAPRQVAARKLLSAQMAGDESSNPISDLGSGDAAEPDSKGSSRRTRRLSKQAALRAAKASSTDAVACPDFFETLNTRLSKPDGRATALASFLQLSCALGAVGILLVGQASGTWSRVGGALSSVKLLTALLLLAAAPAVCLSAFIVRDLRRVMLPAEHLTNLGAGGTLISVAAKARLLWWRGALRWPKFFLVPIGCGSMCLGITMLFKFSLYDGETLKGIGLFVGMFFTGVWLAAVAPLILDWWISLKVASVLAADATAEVVQAAETISPMEPEWTEKVCVPAEQLAEDTMAELTDGWGRALAVVFGICFFLSISMFAGLLLIIAFAPTDNSDLFLVGFQVVTLLLVLGALATAVVIAAACPKRRAGTHPLTRPVLPPPPAARRPPPAARYRGCCGCWLASKTYCFRSRGQPSVTVATTFCSVGVTP